MSSPDDFANWIVPTFNGQAAAGVLSWCDAHRCGPFTRLVGVSLAVMSGPSGVIGPMAVRHVARLTGLSHAIARDHLALLKRAGVFLTVEHPGRIPFLTVAPEIAAGPVVSPTQAARCQEIGSGTHTGTPEPAAPCTPPPESGISVAGTTPTTETVH